MVSSTPHASVSADDVAVPGTVILVDASHVLRRKHVKNHDEIVLVPTPSEDPEDPLNWPPRRKMLANICMLLYVFAIGVKTSVLTPIVVPFSLASTISINDTISGNGYGYLLAGWGLLFWQPFAFQFGKRLTFLFTLGASALLNIWAAYCTANNEWIAYNILSGFLAASVEALPEATIVDLYFTHERGTYMSLYALSLIGGSIIGPIIAGFISDGIGYQWVFYIPSIFCGSVFVFLFFCMEETSYIRKTSQLLQDIDTTQDQSEPTAAQGHPDQKEVIEGATVEPTASHGEGIEYKHKTFWQKMSLINTHGPLSNFFTLTTNQIRFCTFPVVLFSGFWYGLNLVWTVVFGFTSSTILSAPPYNFSAGMVGLTGLAGLIGMFASFLSGGILNDWIALRLVRHNNGIFEPEMRLWLFFLAVILIPASIILWGVGAAHQIHWIGLMFASAFMAFANTTCVPLSINYVIDSYRDMSGMMLTVVIIIRNTMYFAISYGLSPWIENMGLQNAYITCAFVALACTASFLIMTTWGKKIRQRSALRYWALLEDSMARNIVH